jgi:hypothetical protein
VTAPARPAEPGTIRRPGTAAPDPGAPDPAGAAAGAESGTRTRRPGADPAVALDPGTLDPGTERRGQRRGPARPGPGPHADRPGRHRSAAAERAYARREQRQDRLRPARREETTAAPRTPFVLVVMGLLAVGLVGSLWLSTASAGDSYRLEHAQQQARDLAERAEQLRQQVAAAQAAPALADQAGRQGEVPAGDPARIVVRPDGSVVVVGKPTAATSPPAVTPPAPQNPAAGHPAAPTSTAPSGTALPTDTPRPDAPDPDVPGQQAGPGQQAAGAPAIAATTSARPANG